MPSRLHDRPRTPTGRISRKVVPELPVQDLEGIERASYAATMEELAQVEDRIDRLYRASTIVDEADTERRPLRHERNRHIIDLWLNHRARGANLEQAVGVVNTVLYRAKCDRLGVDTLPKRYPDVPKSRAVDMQATRELAASKGITYDPQSPQLLARTTKRIAQLTGRYDAALLVRNWIGVEMVEEGYTRVAVSAMMGREGWQVVRKDLLKTPIPDELRGGASRGPGLPEDYRATLERGRPVELVSA